YKVRTLDRSNEQEQSRAASTTLYDDDDDEVEDEKLEYRKHHVMMSALKRIHFYRALACPLYIAYSYLKNTDPHPMFRIFQLNDLLKEQGELDHEFQKQYQQLSKACEKFAVDLLEECHTVGEIEVMTNVMDELQELSKDQKYVEVKAEGAEELTVLNLAIRSDNAELVAHPYSQLRLNEVLYRNIYRICPCEPPWRRRGLASRLGYSIRHTLLLPLLTFIFVLCPDSKIGRGMSSPVIKFQSHTGSFCMFIVLLMMASFQDKLYDSIATPTVIGFRRYVNQWWNTISCVMLILFVLSYILFMIAYGISGKYAIIDSLYIEFTPTLWYKITLVSNGLFSVAMVLSFVHLSSAFQVSVMFGPMQLSLYRILVDVGKFLVFFFTLFMAFGFSLRRLYSHYISTQMHLTRAMNSGKYNTTQVPDVKHPFS
ncbi:hypothetical protein QZH41_009065, partial [Actinostola sp. cb2023]